MLVSLGNSSAAVECILLTLVNFANSSTYSLGARLSMATGGEGSSSDASGSGVSRAQMDLLMATMRQGLRDEMSALKRELAVEREAADEKLVKKLKLEKAPVFRKKGHEKQYRHNEEVRLKLTDAKSALEEHPLTVEKAKTFLEEGEKIILERQKHIKIADRSDNGWATVEEYMEDELADNSDDEKRLSRADARASKKLKLAAQKSGRGGKRAGPRKFFSGSPVSRSSVVYPSGTGMLGQGGGQLAAGIGYYQGPSGSAAAARPSQGKPVGWNTAVFGPCFECGMPGHVRKYCPKFMSGRLDGTTNR